MCILFVVLVFLSLFSVAQSVEGSNRLNVSVGVYSAFFGGDSPDGFIEVDSRGAVLKFKPERIRFEKGENRAAVFDIEDKLVEKKIKYRNVFGDGIDAEYEFLVDRIKERIVIQNRNRLPETSYLSDTLLIDFVLDYSDDVVLSLDGDSAWDGGNVSTNGSIYFIRRKEPHTLYVVNEFYRILRPFAVDSRGDRLNLSYTIYDSNGETHLTLNIPHEWLRKAKYPIEIDPTVQIRNNDPLGWLNNENCNSDTACTWANGYWYWGYGFLGYEVSKYCDTEDLGWVKKSIFGYDISDIQEYYDNGATVEYVKLILSGVDCTNTAALQSHSINLYQIATYVPYDPEDSSTMHDCSERLENLGVSYVHLLMSPSYCVEDNHEVDIKSRVISSIPSSIAFSIDEDPPRSSYEYPNYSGRKTVTFELDKDSTRIEYDISCSKSDHCLTAEFCDINEDCLGFLSLGADCENKEINGDDDRACGYTRPCAFDSFDNVGYFCSRSYECTHNGVGYSHDDILCDDVGSWYKVCQDDETWSSAVYCDPSETCVNGEGCVSCSDGVMNQDESDVDCGGSCPPCGNGKDCLVDSDCVSGSCVGGTCISRYCVDSCSVVNQLSCAGASGDIWNCVLGLDGCLHKVLYEDCDDLVEYCDDSGVSPVCQPLTVDFSLSVEDAVAGTQVFRQPGDLVTVRFSSPSPQSVNYDFAFECVGGPCSSGVADLGVGVTNCTFFIDENAGAGVYVFNTRERQVSVEVVGGTDTIFVTDRRALFQRFSGDPSGVEDVLHQLYVNAQGQRGVVYYLDDYFNSSYRPWQDYSEYNENPLNPSLSVNAYAIAASFFTTQKCGNCKNIVIIGDDYVVPQYRVDYNTFSGFEFFGHWIEKSPESNVIFSDQRYIPEDTLYLGSIEDIFENYDDRYPIVIVKPDNFEYNNMIQELKDTLVAEYPISPSNIIEMNSNDVGCNSYSELEERTLILIGDRSNNNAIKCIPWFEDYTGTPTWNASIYLERNVWGGDDYAFILAGPEFNNSIKYFNKILEYPWDYADFLEDKKKIYIHEFSDPPELISEMDLVRGFVLGQCEYVGGSLEEQGSCVTSDVLLSVAPVTGILTDVRDIALYCVAYEEPDATEGLVCWSSLAGTASSIGTHTGVAIPIAGPTDIFFGAVKRIGKTTKYVLKGSSDTFLKILDKNGVSIFRVDTFKQFFGMAEGDNSFMKLADIFSAKLQKNRKGLRWAMDVFEDKENPGRVVDTLSSVCKNADDVENLGKGTKFLMKGAGEKGVQERVLNDLMPGVDDVVRAKTIVDTGKIARLRSKQIDDALAEKLRLPKDISTGLDVSKMTNMKFEKATDQIDSWEGGILSKIDYEADGDYLYLVQGVQEGKITTWFSALSLDEIGKVRKMTTDNFAEAYALKDAPTHVNVVKIPKANIEKIEIGPTAPLINKDTGEVIRQGGEVQVKITTNVPYPPDFPDPPAETGYIDPTWVKTKGWTELF